MQQGKVTTGNIFGGMLLVAGSCIGAGMLALPVITGLAGFSLSIILLLVVWAFMTYTALLLIEINGWFVEQVNIVSMAGKALGNVGRVISWVLYLFLFYSLLVAYIAGSGKIVSSFINEIFSFSFSPSYAGLVFAFIFGSVIFFGTKPVDLFNRILMLGLILTYFGMIALGMEKINTQLLEGIRLEYVFVPLSVLITSFGFHNMIPSLTAYLKGDLIKMRTTVLGGSLIALFVYLLWTVLVVGLIPFSGSFGLYEGFKTGTDASILFQKLIGSTSLTNFSQGFAFFAIITSFLAQALALSHFIADGVKVQPSLKNNWCFSLLALVPPAIFAYFFPEIFYKALGFAGGICAVILFGILPAIMAWKGRFKMKLITVYRVKGGKTALIVVIVFSSFIVIKEILRIFGISFLGQ